jgi:hypothetical protein
MLVSLQPAHLMGVLCQECLVLSSKHRNEKEDEKGKKRKMKGTKGGDEDGDEVCEADGDERMRMRINQSGRITYN